MSWRYVLQNATKNGSSRQVAKDLDWALRRRNRFIQRGSRCFCAISYDPWIRFHSLCLCQDDGKRRRKWKKKEDRGRPRAVEVQRTPRVGSNDEVARSGGDRGPLLDEKLLVLPPSFSAATRLFLCPFEQGNANRSSILTTQCRGTTTGLSTNDC